MNKIWWLVLTVLFIVGVLLRLDALLLITFLLALIGMTAWLWQRTCLQGVQYRREFESTRLFYGDVTELRIEVTNAKPLPLPWLRAEDEFSSALEVTPEKAVYSFRSGRRILSNLLTLRWYERVTRRFQVRGTRRGLWHFGPASLASGDLFGFGLKYEQVEGQTSILIYPKLLSLPDMGIPALRPFGDLATSRRLVTDPMRIMGARPYVSGDSYRHIHWKATARHRELQTKVFEPVAARPVAIFVNVNTSRYLIEGLDTELREYAISAAASVARWACESGQPTGMYANAVMQPGGLRLRLPPRIHPDQLLEILESLARLTGYGRWPMETLVAEESRHFAYGTAVVVVSAVVSDELKEVLVDLNARGSTATLITVGEPMDADLPVEIRHFPIGGRKEWNELASLAMD
ncbi:MAG: DUF58 domain-containing protein [Caldilineaceae bacterium]